MHKYGAKTPWLLKKLYPELVWNFNGSEPNIFLTFDDGPTPHVTPFVLNTLSDFNAKATFFCIGDSVQKHPDIFSDIKAAGHAIGNHTFNHLRGLKTVDSVYLENFLKCEEALGAETTLFRPPYGSIKRKQIQMLKKIRPNLQVIMWDVLSWDFDVTLSPEKCLRNVMTHAKNGSIVVFHDSVNGMERLKYVLPRALEYWTEKQYQFNLLQPASTNLEVSKSDFLTPQYRGII